MSRGCRGRGAWAAKKVHAALAMGACFAAGEDHFSGNAVASAEGNVSIPLVATLLADVQQLERAQAGGEERRMLAMDEIQQKDGVPLLISDEPTGQLGTTTLSPAGLGCGERTEATCVGSVEPSTQCQCLWDSLGGNLCIPDPDCGQSATASTTLAASGSAECQVLSGIRGTLVQMLLFFCCLAILFFKFLRDHGGRTFLEFAMDSSKQIIGAGWVHMLNLLAAVMLEATLADQGSECSWYWLNIVLDCTLGLATSYVLLRFLTALIQAQAPEHAADFRSGEYSVGARKVSPAVYIKQLVLWLAVLTLMKVCMLTLLVIGSGFFVALAELALWPLSCCPDLQLVYVMVVTPVFFNAFQFWVTDNFLKKKGGGEAQSGASAYDVEREGSMQTTIRHDGGL